MTGRGRRLAFPVGALCVLAVVLATTGGRPAGAAERVAAPEPYPFTDRYPAAVLLAGGDQLDALARLAIEIGDLAPAPGAPLGERGARIATVYVNPAEATRLAAAGLTARPIANEGLRGFRAFGPGSAARAPWPTYDGWVARLQGIAAAYPQITRLVSIGKSVRGRDLWALKISDNPDLEEDEPEVRYSSTMHGDEPVGTEMTLRLAELLTSSYGVDPKLTYLVDQEEIWLLPLHNPDGYVSGSRYNANGRDLNRDFPDPVTDPVDDPAGRQLETQAFMYFGYDHSMTMGANYHGGAQVVNIPWDSIAAYAPDDAIYYQLGLGYAQRNSYIRNGGFANGMTRGWQWYIIHGGMQDWAYNWHGEHHVTIELSNQKWPPYDNMNAHWDQNRLAMLWWASRALTGLRGRVTDAVSDAPLAALVRVEQIGTPVATDPDVGDYHRLLLPGTYTVTVSAAGHLSQQVTVTVPAGLATVRSFALQPAP